MDRVEEQPTQNETVLKHLEEVGPITNMEIIGKYQISGPRARINDLKHQDQYEDVEILDREIEKNGKTFKQYFLASNPPDDVEVESEYTIGETGPKTKAAIGSQDKKQAAYDLDHGANEQLTDDQKELL